MWRTKKLSQVCDIQSGLWKGKKEPFTEAYVLRNTNFTPGGEFDYADVALLQVETKQLEKRIVLPNDIILEKSGGGEKTPVGRVCLHTSELDKPVSFSNFTARLRVLNVEELTPTFLHRFLYFLYISGKTEPMQRNSTGIRNLQISQYKDLDIPLPPLADQHRIIAKLDAAFTDIEEAIKFSEKHANGAKIYGYRVIQNMLEELTKRHGKSYLSDIAIIQPQKKLALEKVSEHDEVSFMAMEGLGIEKKYSKAEINKPLKDVYKSYQYFEDDDVVFAKITPCFENGKLSIVSGLTNGVGFGSSEFVVLRTHAKFNSEFLYYCLLDKVFREEGKENMSGAVGHKRVTKEYIYNYDVPIPPLDVQQLTVKKFDEVWKNTRTIVSTKHKKIQELTNLKSAILAAELKSEAL